MTKRSEECEFDKLMMEKVLEYTFPSGTIVGGVVVPHGDFAFDPSLVDSKNGSTELHNVSRVKWSGAALF